MCDNCESRLSEMNEPEELAQLALATLGGLLEAYIEEGYSDPMMYKAMGIGSMIAEKLGAQEMAERFTFNRILSGEIINHLSEEHKISTENGEVF